MEKSYISKSLDHLGIVSGMIDELGIVEEIDKHLQIDGSERALSLGLLCKSLIIIGTPSLKLQKSLPNKI